jgi:hypothetical protein
MTHLPVAALCSIIIPTIMFGMFTMGLNPEDSALRTWYYLAVTAAMPVSMLAGYLLALIPARKMLLVLLDAATGVAAFLSYLWFQARISIVPADNASIFPGWQWQSHYQQDVLIALVVIVSCRCGMSFPRRGATPSAEGDPSVVWAASCSLMLVASAYLVSWLLGTWWILHLGVACLAFAGCGIQVLLPNQVSSGDDRPAATEPKNRIWISILFGFGVPFLMLAQGFSIGLSFVANSWSAGWLGHIGVILLTAGLVACGILAIEKRFKRVVGIAWLLLAATGLLLGIIALLIFHAFLPVEIGWAVASGGAAGLVAVALAKLATNIRHPFRATVHLLLALFCVLLGIGGGIAYYLYSGQSITLLPESPAVLSDVLIVRLVSGAAVLAVVVIVHVPAISSIIRALYHKVKGSP